MDHVAVAASALTAVVITRLIALAISGAVVIDQHTLLLLGVIHVIASWVHVLMLIQVIMVGNIIMMTVCSIRRNVRS
jgi:hypothetical protein